MASEMIVRKFDDSMSEEWDAFVSESCNGTIYHTRRFLGYHPPDRFQDESLMVWAGDRLVGVLPAARQMVGDLPCLRSHPGASYGGLVFRPDESFHRMYAMVEAVVQYAREAGFRRMEWLRLTPKPYCCTISNELEMSLHLHGFAPTRRELSCGMSIRGEPEAVLSSATQWSVRRAAREGVTVVFADDWGTFWRLLEKSLGDRHGARPTHAVDEIMELQSRCPDEIRLLAARREDQLVAGAVVFTCNRRALYTMYIAMDYQFARMQPIYACLAHLIEWGVAQGFSFLDIGVCTEGNGINWGLYSFKERFGCHGYFRESYGRDL